MPAAVAAQSRKLASIFAVLCAAACGLSAVTGSALANDLNAIGGKGGEPFESRCRPNDALIGINLRSGTALDAVSAICRPLTKKYGWTGKSYEPTQYWGGNGGGRQKAVCKRDYVVGRLKVYVMRWGNIMVVNSISIRCKNYKTFHEYDITPRRAGTIIDSANNSCNRGFATGIHGGYGNLVDRLGLSCY